MRSKEPTEKLLRLLEEGKARILSATVSREADRYYVSLTCEVARLSRSVADVGWGAFRRMLEYKAGWYGATLIVAPRSFPTR